MPKPPKLPPAFVQAASTVFFAAKALARSEADLAVLERHDLPLAGRVRRRLARHRGFLEHLGHHASKQAADEFCLPFRQVVALLKKLGRDLEDRPKGAA